MKRMLINAQTEELRVAIVSDGLLNNLYIEPSNVEEKKSNIYKGKISSIEPSLNAVFVDYGSERHGFLPLKEISRDYFQTSHDENLKNPDIQKLLRLGQEIVVQVDKDERGTKGAALTTFITLAGSYLVLMPNNPRAGGISRRIEGDERDQLRDLLNSLNVPEGMGIIIRTAGVNRSAEELQWDLNFLLHYWDAIKQATNMKKGPYLIHQESDGVIRAIRDNLRHDTLEIIIDEVTAFERAKSYLQQLRPDFVENIKLYTDSLPLFSRFQVERQIELAYQREVQLPSGGSIVIDHTEALVSIDINSARATKGGNIEETAYHTNLEAAEEIARQLRIRDIGGLVVIDFIDMMQNKNQREVENRLRESLQMDRARIQIGRISRFGLLEMSRQRLRSSLAHSIHVTCPRCDGQGSIRGVESLAHSIVHLIQEQAVKTENMQIQVQAPLDVATYILNEKRDVLDNITKDTKVEILIIPNQYLQSPQYSIKHVKIDTASKAASSYKLVKFPKAESVTNQKVKSAIDIAEPAINKFLSDESNITTTTPSANLNASVNTTPAPTKQQNNVSLIKRIFDAMFGSSTTSNTQTKTTAAKKATTTTATARSKQHNADNRHRQPHSPDARKPQSQRRDRDSHHRTDRRHNHDERADQTGSTSDHPDDHRGTKDVGASQHRKPHHKPRNQSHRNRNEPREHHERREHSERREHEHHQDNSAVKKAEPAKNETATTVAATPVQQPVITSQPTPTPVAPMEKTPATPKQPQQNLVKEPSPLETQSSSLKQVRSTVGESQESLQQKAKEAAKEIRSETKEVPKYTGLGQTDAGLQQVRTKKED